MSGKGDTPRPVDGDTYRREHDRIFGRRLPDGWLDVHWPWQEQVHVKLTVCMMCGGEIELQRVDARSR